MLIQTMRICCPMMFGLLLLASTALAQVHHDHHPPYVDPHFDLHHTPLYDYGTRSTYSDYGSHAGPCTNGSCNGAGSPRDSDSAAGKMKRGSRSPKCPPIDNAPLTLYVPDGLQVEINGQRAKMQSLAGIHRNSRIFLLDGLAKDQDSPCTIVVHDCDAHGAPRQYVYNFSVRAGEHYKVLYPVGFQEFSENVPIGPVPTSF